MSGNLDGFMAISRYWVKILPSLNERPKPAINKPLPDEKRLVLY